MQIKISKKREAMLKAAIFTAFSNVTDNLDGASGPPSLWTDRAVETYDFLLALEQEIKKEIFTSVFISNKATNEKNNSPTQSFELKMREI